MTSLVRILGDPPKLPVRANWGRWIVECPVCPSALLLQPDDSTFQCWDCGAAGDTEWPEESMREGVERLLSMRPNEITRNWEPGETLHDLMKENAYHGLFSGLPEGIPGRTLLAVTDNRIVTDILPAITYVKRRELGA